MIDDMKTWLTGFLLAMYLILVFAPARQRASCPTMNEYVEGVRRDGTTWCAKSPPLSEPDCTTLDRCDGREPTYTVPIRVHCTGGAYPIVIDHRTIGCQR